MTLVCIGRNGPPVGRPGFMSKVSIWLAPPFIHSRMQRLALFWHLGGDASRVEQAAPVGDGQAAAGDKRPLEEGPTAEMFLSWTAQLHGLVSDSGEQAKPVRPRQSMVEAKLRAVDQHPDGLLDQRLGCLGVRGEVGHEALPLLGPRQTGQDR